MIVPKVHYSHGDGGSLELVIRSKLAKKAGIKAGDILEFSIIDGEQVIAKPGDLVLRRI